MGIVNVTPDSFSDGGRTESVAAAVEHGMRLVTAGADLVDVGGESTRPGAARTDATIEQARVLPVVEQLAAAGVRTTVDTMRASTAALAVEAGACGINDVSGGRADPEMFGVVAAAGVPYMLMHWRGRSADMQRRAVYDDVVGEVLDELSEQVGKAMRAGIAPERIAVDPGLGFAKTAEHSWRLVAGIDQLHRLGHPLLVGASRKQFLGRISGTFPSRYDQAERDQATAAVTALVAAAGVWCVRVHAAAASRIAAGVAAAGITDTTGTAVVRDHEETGANR